MLILILALPASLSTAAAALTLASGGGTSYPIVTSTSPTAEDTAAANELQSYLNQVTGASFLIKTEAQVGSTLPQILVGQSTRSKQLITGVNWTTLPAETTILRIVGNKVVLTGGKPRGTLYAVYTFLEDYVGVKWWTSSASTVPNIPTLNIDSLDVNYTPQIWFRWVRYYDTIYRSLREASNPTSEARRMFAARLKLNGPDTGIDTAYGGYVDARGGLPYNMWLPPDQYFATYPHWYSLVDGARRDWSTQLCLMTSDAAMRNTFWNRMNMALNSPSYVGVSVVGASPNDWPQAWCECDLCVAKEAAERAPMGPILDHANYLADRLAATRPGMLFEVWAYQYYTKPPLTVRPRSNTIVSYCTSPADPYMPFSSDANARWAVEFDKWASFSPKLGYMDYYNIDNNLLLPEPNYSTMGPSLAHAASRGMQYYTSLGNMYNAAGDFVALRAWLTAHLAWNPNLDQAALISEFMSGYYGAAGPHLVQYLSLIEDAWRSLNRVTSRGALDISYATLDFMNAANDLFDAAENAVAGDPVLLDRVRTDRLPLDLLWLMRYWILKDESQATGKLFKGPANIATAVESYIAAVSAKGAFICSEARTTDSFYAQLRSPMVQQPQPKTPGTPSQAVGKVWRDRQDKDFEYNKFGVVSDVVDDTQASDGRACRVYGSVYELIAVHRVRPSDVGKWRVYVVAKYNNLDSSRTEAFKLGIFQSSLGKHMYNRTVTKSEASQTSYITYDMGSWELRPGDFVWISGPKDTASVNYAYFDRVYLVQETSGRYWNALGGNWNDPSKWQPYGVPAAGETVTVGAGGTCSMDASAANPGNPVEQLRVGYDRFSEGSVELQSGAELNVSKTGYLIAGHYGTGTFTQNGGDVVLDSVSSPQIQRGYVMIGAFGWGTYVMNGGAIRRAGTHYPMVYVGSDAAGDATFRGWGTVGSYIYFYNNGKVIAESPDSSDRTLDLSSAFYIGNSLENRGTDGWFARNRGKLTIKSANVAVGASGECNWGEKPDDAEIDLTNSARISFSTVRAAGAVTGSLLAPDRSDVSLPSVATVGIWDFAPSGGLSFSTCSLTICYNGILATSLGYSESKLRILQLRNGEWVNVTAAVDTASNLITTSSLTSLGRFAVSLPVYSPVDIGAAKARQNGATVSLRGIVSATFGDFFYVESADRSSGIRVSTRGFSVSQGQVVEVSGTIGVLGSGERYIDPEEVVQSSL